MAQIEITNEAIKEHSFLADMYADNKFPRHLVDKGRAILMDLCHKIETRVPKTLTDLYDLTHRATDSFNDLQDEFKAKRSKYDAVASKNINDDFAFIVSTYGYFEADEEELTGPREW